MPDVPNWLQWIVTILAPTVVLWSIARYLWRWKLSDLWAKRNRDSAMKKAEILVKQYREALYLVDDDRRFQAVSTMIISNLISAGIMMFLGVGFFILIFGINFYFPLSGGKLLVTSAVGLMLFLQGVQAASDTMDKRRIAIKPYIDWVGYHEATLARIGSLLATAGLDDGEQAIFINNVVSIVDEEIIGPENDEVDED